MLRHLRRLYRDPLTGSAGWGVVKGPDGGVIGVYSQAPGKPLKQDGFPASLGISRQSRYADWIFLYDERR